MAGVTAISWVLEIAVATTPAPPKATVERLVKPVPVIVTVCPPVVGPLVGANPLTVGAGAT
jgi:hypothetical protein